MRIKNITKLERTLFIILISLVIVLAVGTIIGISRNNGSLTQEYRKSDPTPNQVVNLSAGKENSVDAYTDLGQIRARTKLESEDSSPALVVVSPWFSYPSGEKALYEELSQKQRMITALIGGYFSGFTMDELKAHGETNVKEDLLDSINSQLVMGKIRAVYFNDYVFID